MNKLYLEVEVDTNDGDMVTERSLVTQEDVDKYFSIIKKVHKDGQRSINWSVGECRDIDETPSIDIANGTITEQEAEFVDGYSPSTEYGYHTIDSVRLLVVESETDLLELYGIK